MITVGRDGLSFSFPEVHPDARLTIALQRTFRIPDDGKEYPNPLGLDRFPLRLVDDPAENLSADTVRGGGVLVPMLQSEALWIMFYGHQVLRHDTEYPFAVQISTGGTCAVTGYSQIESLLHDVQNYVVVPGQPLLDSFYVGEGIVRQCVAEPLGQSLKADEQKTGETGPFGLQIEVIPMKSEVFRRVFPWRPLDPRNTIVYMKAGQCHMDFDLALSESASIRGFDPWGKLELNPGGRMLQEIYSSPLDRSCWSIENRSRCFLHILNSKAWHEITGDFPSQIPLTELAYREAGLPWFDWYDDDCTSD